MAWREELGVLSFWYLAFWRGKDEGGGLQNGRSYLEMSQLWTLSLNFGDPN